MWFICTMDYYSAVKRNEVLIYGTERMTLEDIMLSDRSQMQRNPNPTYYMILSTYNVQNRHLCRERKMSGCKRLQEMCSDC